MRATLIIGGNIGNRDAYLRFASFHIIKTIGEIKKESQIYETEAWGDKAEKPFLNQVIEVETKLEAIDLLEALQNIENMAGRTRFDKWGDRTLDIDILYLEDQVINEMILTIPHPRIAERKFTLVPLDEIKPDFIHPVLNQNTSELLRECKDKLTVKPFQKRGV